MYYCSTECQTLHWAAGHKKECKVLGKIHQDVKQEGKDAEAPSDQAPEEKMGPKQGSGVVEDLVKKLKRRRLFFEDNVYLYDENGKKKMDGDYMIKRFKFYAAFLSDEEVSDLGESESFEEMETFFNLLVTKYSKLVGEMPKNWTGWENNRTEKNDNKSDKEGKEGRNCKGKKSKKVENKRRLRRKLL